MDSVEFAGPTPVNTKIRSNTRNASSVLNSKATKIDDFNNGKVILKNCCHLFDPSTLDASYNEFGIVCKPASNNKAMQGVVFQTSAKMIEKRPPLPVDNNQEAPGMI